MSWLFDPTSWTTATSPSVTDFQHIYGDIHTWGGNVNAATFYLLNSGAIQLNPGTLPASPVSGMVAIDATGVLKRYFSGSWAAIASSGQTPWGSNIDAATFRVSNLSQVGLNSTTLPTAVATGAIAANGGKLYIWNGSSWVLQGLQDPSASGILKRTATNVTSIAVGADLPTMVASGASHSGGAVPDPGASAGTTKYLREDGTFQIPPGGSAVAAGAANDIQFCGSGNAFNADTGVFVWDPTNNRLGIGVGSPSTDIDIRNNAGNAVISLQTSYGAAASFCGLTGVTYSGSSGNSVAAGLEINCASLRGTSGSPSAVKAGDGFFVVYSLGHDGVSSGQAGAAYQTVVGSDWTNTNHDTVHQFYAVAPSSTSLVEMFRITGLGISVGGAPSFGGGSVVIYLKNATTVPTTNPSGGVLIYADAGALKCRGSAGTVTTIGAA